MECKAAEVASFPPHNTSLKLNARRKSSSMCIPLPLAVRAAFRRRSLMRCRTPLVELSFLSPPRGLAVGEAAALAASFSSVWLSQSSSSSSNCSSQSTQQTKAVKSKKSSKGQKNGGSAMELDGYLASLGLGSKKGARKKGASGGASTGLYLVKNSAITGGGK